MAVILGLNAFHGDSSACLVRDGKLIAGAEEERFRRIKHWSGMPSEAIRYVLSEAGLKLADVEHVSLNRDPSVNNFRRIAYALRRMPSPKLILNRVRNIRRAASVEDSLAAAFPGEPLRAKFHHIERHLAHLAEWFEQEDDVPFMMEVFQQIEVTAE